MPIEINNNIHLDAHINADDILELAVIGNTTAADHGDELIAWANKTRMLLAELKQKNNGIAQVLANIGGAGSFDDGTIKVMTELAAAPESAGVKTAIYGGSMLTKMALRTIVAFAHRKEIKHFATKEEALAWLKESS